MEWIQVCGCIFTAWALLRLVGGERQRRLDKIAIEKMIAESEEAESRKSDLQKTLNPDKSRI